MKRLVLPVVFIAALAATAAADSHEATPEVGDPSGAMPAAVEGEVARVGPFAKQSYPTELIFRPLTLPAGMAEVTPDISYAQIDFGLGSVDATALGLFARYGVTDQLEVGLATSLLVDPEFEWGESLIVRGAFSVYDTEMIDIAPALTVPLSFADGEDVLPGIILGADTRILLNEMLFVLVGQNLLPIGFDPSAVNIDVNLAGGVQITPQVAALLTTQPLSLAVSGDGNETTHYGDFIPIGLQGLFAINHQVDAFLRADFPSIEDAGDFFILSAGANVRL